MFCSLFVFCGRGGSLGAWEWTSEIWVRGKELGGPWDLVSRYGFDVNIQRAVSLVEFEDL